MQTDYLFNGIRGYITFRKFSYLFDMDNKEANDRYKIIQFFDKYGLEATIEAFAVSRRTIYRWKSKLKENGIASLKPKSTKPKKLRTPTTPKLIIDEIKKLRIKYPNIGKAKLHVLLESFCKSNNLSLPSESTIGRVISKDKDKMNQLKYNNSNEVGIAISNTYSIDKDSIPEHLKNNTLFLILENPNINSCDSKRTQLHLIKQINILINELSNTKKKIHLFVSARASFTIRMGMNYTPRSTGEIVLHNYSKQKRDWSISLHNNLVI